MSRAALSHRKWVSRIVSRIVVPGYFLFRRMAVRRIMGAGKGTEKNHG